MANNLVTTQKVTWETLAILSNTLKVWPNLYNGYEDEFGRPGEKIGQTLSVRKPQRYVGRTGSLFTPEGLNNLVTPVSVSQQNGVDSQLSTLEKYLSIENISGQYLRPAAVRIANMLDFAASQFLALNTFNIVGTQGTTPTGSTAFKTYLLASKKLDQFLADPEERCMVINSDAKTEVVDQLKGQFNPQAVISRMYQRNMMGRDTGGMDWYQSENLASLTSGPLGGTPLVDGASQTADGGNNATMSLNTKGWTAAAAARLSAGDHFTIAGVFVVNAANYQATSVLQQFVVLQDFSSDSAGKGGVLIAPAITPAGQYQNVSAAPADGAAITVFAAASTAGTMLPLFQRDAAAVVSVPGDVPGGVDMGYQERDPETGVYLRFARVWDPVHDIWASRFDVYWGISSLYREFAAIVAAA